MRCKRSIASDDAALKSRRKSFFGFFSNVAPEASFVKPCAPWSVMLSSRFHASGEKEKKPETYGPVLFRGGPQRGEDDVELVHVGFGGHERDAEHQLGKDATCGPDVDAGAVRPRAEEQFRAAVPAVCTRNFLG